MSGHFWKGFPKPEASVSSYIQLSPYSSICPARVFASPSWRLEDYPSQQKKTRLQGLKTWVQTFWKEEEEVVPFLGSPKGPRHGPKNHVEWRNDDNKLFGV